MPSSKWERKGVAVCSLDHKRKESRCSVILEISKSTRRSFVLVALVCLLLYRLPGRSKLSLVQYSSYGQRSARQINENTLGNSSFLIPESYTTRYPQLENRTAAESVAAEYKQTALQANSSEYDPLASCSVTSQVRVVQNNPLWILESIDAKGNPKTVGGDEFYVTYRDDIVAKATEVTAAAFIDDLGDGTYSLDFVTTPMNPIPSNLTGRGTLTVNFQYSCGIGKAHQPVKDKWTMGGATFIRHSAANVTQPLIRKCERPTNAIDLRTFDKVIAFGDSIMEQQFILKGSNLKKQIKEQYFRPNVYWRENPASELVNAKLFRFMTKLESWHGEDLLNSSNTALIVGSAIWDIIAKKTNSVGPGFTDHLDTCRRFIEVIRELYPTVTVIWKAPTAMVRTFASNLASFGWGRNCMHNT